MPTIRVRVSDPTCAVVDELAAEHGTTRSEIVRRMIDAYARDLDAPPAGPPTLDEAVSLLAAQARNGIATSTVALVRHLVQHANGTVPPSDPLAELDELARRRVAESGRNGDGDAA